MIRPINNKKRLVLILIIISFLLFIIFIILYFTYFKSGSVTPSKTTSTSKVKTFSNVTKVRKLSFFENDPILKNISDDYKLPDFNRFEEQLREDSLVNSLPKEGSIRIGIFHFIEGYRKWDNIYYITKANVETKNKQGDFDLWIHTDYVEDYDGKNLCDIMKDAKEKGDLGQTTRLTKREIFFKYFRLISYRDCFGI